MDAAPTSRPQRPGQPHPLKLAGFELGENGWMAPGGTVDLRWDFAGGGWRVVIVTSNGLAHVFPFQWDRCQLAIPAEQ